MDNRSYGQWLVGAIKASDGQAAPVGLHHQRHPVNMASAMRVVNASKGAVVTERVREARTYWSRLVGLLGRRGLAEGEGLLIAPCSSIHTLFMRFPIDVAFLDRDGRVVRAYDRVPPFRLLTGGRGAHMALELPAGTLARTDTRSGDFLQLLP